ncbi:5'-nucleotidase C-terminal domain-containing protein [soil metagenome]
MARSFLVALAFPGLFLSGCGGAPVPASGAEDPSDTSRIVVVGTTDVHGWLLPWDYSAGEPVDRGLALLAPLVDSIRNANPGRVVLVDSGDLLQGSPMAAAHTPLAEGEVHPVIEAMNQMRYDAAALGNHEFNFGIEHLHRVLSDASFPFLAANVVDAASGEPVWPGGTLVDLVVDGLPFRVGIAGALPPGVAVWDRDHVEGRLAFPPMLDQLRVVIPELQEAGADLVIVAAHSGLEGTSYDPEATGLGPENQMAEVAREVPGIHAIFMGHTHQEIADSVFHGVRLAQAGAHARSLAVVELTVTPGDNGRWQVVRSEGKIIRPEPGSATSDPRMESSLAAAHDRTLSLVNRVLATSSEAWPASHARVRDTQLLRWMSDVQRDASGAQLSAVAAFNLEAGIPEGEVRVSDIARVYPYDNNLLRAVEIDGADLRAYLEHAARYFLPCPGGSCDRIVNPDWPGYNFDVIHGVSYTLDLARPVGERVTRLEFEGAPVSGDQRFTLALNNYRQGGGGGFPAVASAPVTYSGTESIRDLLIADIEARGARNSGGRIDPPAGFEPEWEIVPAALREQAHREMRAGGR